MEDQSENKQIEQYLKQYCLEDCLDEALNVVVTNRSNNPYTALSEAILMKSLPEIIDIMLIPVIVKASYAVRAILTTSIGTFSATVCYNNKVNSENGATSNQVSITPEAPDLLAIEQKVREVLLAIDPRNVGLVDESLLRVHNIRQEESLAISMAAAKAASKYNGYSLYELIAELAETRREDLITPLPVTVIAARVVNTAVSNPSNSASNPPVTPGNKGKDSKSKEPVVVENADNSFKTPVLQCVQLFPNKASTIDGALHSIININRLLNKLEKISHPKKVTNFGCLLVEGTNTLEDLAQMINNLLAVNDLQQDLRMGVVYEAHKLAKTVESSYLYQIDAVITEPVEQPAANKKAPAKGKDKKAAVEEPPKESGKSSQDVVESIISLWHSLEFISVNCMLHESDLNGLRYLNKRLQESVYDAKASNDKLLYCMKGVGNDKTCNLQVLLENKEFLNKESQVLQEMPFNTFKLNFYTSRTVSEAVSLCRKAKKLNYSVVISSLINECENTDCIILNDDFDVDFAVGVSASQIHLGGIFAAEYSMKLNRLQEIIFQSPGMPYVGPNFRLSS